MKPRKLMWVVLLGAAIGITAIYTGRVLAKDI